MSERPPFDGSIGKFETAGELIENVPTIVKPLSVLNEREANLEQLRNETAFSADYVEQIGLNAALGEVGVDIFKLLTNRPSKEQ